MYEFRQFRNDDPPHLAAIWRSQLPLRAVVQPMSADLLEYAVFSKPFFDPAGLLVAVQDGKRIGFVHAGFGPSDHGMKLDTMLGTTHMLLVHAEHQSQSLEDDLLRESERYLRENGAKVLFGGSLRPLDGFYRGLYGGSELPGVLDSDYRMQDLLTRNGYCPASRVRIFQREMLDFVPPVSRKLRMCLRISKLNWIDEPSATSWWEASTRAAHERRRLELNVCVSGCATERIGHADTWDLEPMASAWGIRAAGIVDLNIDKEHRRKGFAALLVVETLRALKEQGVTLVEVQTMESNEPAAGLYLSLGFIEIDGGAIFRKGSSTETGSATVALSFGRGY